MPPAPNFWAKKSAPHYRISPDLLLKVLMFNVHEIGSWIIRKIIKIVATRRQILRIKCAKFDFGWGSAPDSAGGAYSAPPDPLAGFKGPTSREGKGKREGGGKGE